MAVTNAMEKTRLSLHHFGKLLFSQLTELMNPAMNRGLPPNLASSDPSLDYHCKGIDIASAAYTAELGFLASPVSTHIQSAEMHNQGTFYLFVIGMRFTNRGCINKPSSKLPALHSLLGLIIYSSMALVSARMTIQSLEVLSLLTSNYIYTLCQGVYSFQLHILLIFKRFPP